MELLGPTEVRPKEPGWKVGRLEGWKVGARLTSRAMEGGRVAGLVLKQWELRAVKAQPFSWPTVEICRWTDVNG